MTGWMRLRSLMALGAFACACVWASWARAGTVDISGPEGPGDLETLTVAYEAAPGEANRLSISMTADQRTWIISEVGGTAPVVADAPCTAVAPQMATCSIPDGLTELFLQVHVDLGDMDDRATASGACGAILIEEEFQCAVTVDGGEGDDRMFGPEVGRCSLRGGPGGDFLVGGRDRLSSQSECTFDGGPGADNMRGANRPGDTVSYPTRVNPVFVSLQDCCGGARRNDGEAGEHDVVLDVTNVVTGSGNDVVLGNARANGIFTGAGNDVVSAGAGNDSILSDAGGDVVHAGRGNDSVNGGFFGRSACRLQLDWHDRLYGGYGNDVLRGCRGNDRIEGGPGRDAAVGGPGSDTIIGGLGRDVLSGWAGNDTLYARDGFADRVGGASGHDRARVDPGRDSRSSIEQLF